MYLQEADVDKWVLAVLFMVIWWATCTECLPQHISRSLSYTRHRTELCIETRQRRLVAAFPHQDTHTHTSNNTWCIRNQNTTQLTHIFLSLFVPQLFCSVFVQCFRGSGSLGSCFHVARCETIFCPCPVVVFALCHLPVHWVFCAFSFGCFSVCFAACIRCLVAHIKYKYALILVLHFSLWRTSYRLYITLRRIKYELEKQKVVEKSTIFFPQMTDCIKDILRKMEANSSPNIFWNVPPMYCL